MFSQQEYYHGSSKYQARRTRKSLGVVNRKGFEMSDREVPLDNGDSGSPDPADLAAQHFDILNGMSTQKWFADNKSRENFIDDYISFIESHGSSTFRRLAERQEAANNGWSNNVAFRKCLQREESNAVLSSESLMRYLMVFRWISRSAAKHDLLNKAARCRRSAWVEAKAQFIDSLSLSPAEKAELLDHALSDALAEDEGLGAC